MPSKYWTPNWEWEERWQRRIERWTAENKRRATPKKLYGRYYELLISQDPAVVRKALHEELRFLDFCRIGKGTTTGLPFGNTCFHPMNTYGQKRYFTPLSPWLIDSIATPMTRLRTFDERERQRMSTNERLYLDLLARTRLEGEYRPNRTGVGAYTLFGDTLRFDLRKGFPLLTTKKMAWKAIVAELLWFIQGCPEDMAILKANNCRIWDANVEANGGKVGPIYGRMWRDWPTYQKTDQILETTYEGTDQIDRRWIYTAGPRIDQLADLIHKLRTNPRDRRLIIASWNPAEIPNMCLPPCHSLTLRFDVTNAGELDMRMTQRSCDMFLGVPFNIASSSLLLMMIAQVTGLKPRYFIHDLDNIHIYENHVEQVERQLTRDPYLPPKVTLNPDIKEIDDFTMDDIILTKYECHPTIKAEMAV